MSNELVLKRFANCVPVKGYSRSAIYDLIRGKYKVIPNEMYDLLIEEEGKTRKQIYNQYNEHQHSRLDEYFQFLEQSEFIFWIDKKLANNFPNLSMEWLNPYSLINAIVEIHPNNNIDWVQFWSDITDLGCKHVALYIYTTPIINERH